MSKQSLEQQEAIKHLRDTLKPGDKVYTILRHVSRSGMTRDIDVYFWDKEGNKRWLSYQVAKALDYPMHGDAVRVGGAGMDMGFHLIYSLSSVLFREGFKCLGKNCPANDHHNPPYPERKRGSMTHYSGGYALGQEWL